MPKTIAIRSPRIREVVDQERRLGAGRTATEVAEHLIIEAVERRRLQREMRIAGEARGPAVPSAETPEPLKAA